MKESIYNIQMKAPERYERMVVQTQIKYAPINRTEAIKMLMDEGAKTLLKDFDNGKKK